MKKIADGLSCPAAGPDSRPGRPIRKWIAYTLNSATYIQKVFVYSLEQDKSYPDHGRTERGRASPSSTPTGKYLYFLASTDAGPVKQWFDMSNADMRLTSSHLRRRPDQGRAQSSRPRRATRRRAPRTSERPCGKPADKPAEKSAAPADQALRQRRPHRFRRLERRILALPVPAGNYGNLLAGRGGTDLLPRAARRRAGLGRRPGGSLHKYDFKTRKDEVVLTGRQRVHPHGRQEEDRLRGPREPVHRPAPAQSPSRGRASSTSRPSRSGSIRRPNGGRSSTRPGGSTATTSTTPNMHGADWPAMKDKYAVFLPHLSCRGDLNRVIQWMCSELGVGHHRVGGGDSPYRAETRRRRPARRRLRRRKRPLPLQEGVRRPELESGAPFAADGARRRTSRPANTCWPSTGRDLRPPAQPLRLLREHGRQDRRDHRRSESGRDGRADDPGRARRERSAPCATATGSRAT